MDREQLQHYLKGGKFKAIYSPKVIDNLGKSNVELIGETCKFWQNTNVSPISGDPIYMGQHAFNSNRVWGWSPEEDLMDLVIIDEYITKPEVLPRFIYRLTYSTMDEIMRSWPHSKTLKAPLVFGREYSAVGTLSEHAEETFSRVLSGNQKPTRLEGAIWNGEPYNEIKWEEVCIDK